MNSSIAFLGAGKMVSAIVKSLLRANSFSAKQISCCSAKDGTSEKLSEETGICRFDSVESMLAKSPSVMVLGCKPQQIKELPPSIAETSEGCLILSIMAGITINKLNQAFPKARNIVRSMPNTPGQIGHGLTGYLFKESPENSDQVLIEKILSSLGPAFELKEEDDLDGLLRLVAVDPLMCLNLPVP